MLKLKIQYFGHLMRRSDSLEKTRCWERLKAEGAEDNREWDGWMASLTGWAWVWASSEGCWWTGKPGILQSMGLQKVGHNWATELNWCIIEVSEREERKREGMRKDPDAVAHEVAKIWTWLSDGTTPVRTCEPRGTLLSAQWWSKWEGNPKKSGYRYSWLTLLYSRN